MISAVYFMLLGISVLVYWLLPSQFLRNGALIIISFSFIYLMDKKSVFVVIGLTMFSYLAGQWIARSSKRGAVHTLCIAALLVVLILFKYLGLLTSVVNGLLSFFRQLPQFHITKLLLPLGISYIVFKHISYLTDVKWGLIEPGRLYEFLLYSSLFTIFIAGPIERFERFKPNIAEMRVRFQWKDMEYGFMRIVVGLFKKLVLADWLGYFINTAWLSPGRYGPTTSVLGIIGFSFQIYFDFAGYSDIAIGASRLLGIHIMENFNNPYLASDIGQFWRRWHISLSDWIRDYIFFPISKWNTSKFWRKICVPVIAMALCGLWHGPAFHFLLWGIWHGLGLAMLQLWNEYKRKHSTVARLAKMPWFNLASMAMTFCYVTIGWFWFRGI